MSVAWEWLGLLLLAGGAGLWFDTLKAREAGMRAVRAACRGEQFQLLDDTVALVSVRLRRNDDGRLRLRRIYAFEYSDTGDNRRPGSVALLGHRVVLLDVGLIDLPSERILH